MQEEKEVQLQEYFIHLLTEIGYQQVEINNETDLRLNFKKQLKSFNSGFDFNFDDVYDYLCRGNAKFDKLRSTYNGVRFIDFSDFSSNIFQVTSEVTVSRDLINRYDVTILINGLPIVQIELKKSGIELKTAFNQIKRYDYQSYSGLFDFIQIFAISNKVHTRYFFNGSDFDYDFTYTWKDNRDLESFTYSFLDKNNLMKVLSQYIFKDSISNDYLMLRPYQANIIDLTLNKVEKNETGYVWMSYNTGKTVTSFRLAEVLKDSYQVIYVTVDDISKYPDYYSVRNHDEFLMALETQNLIVTNIRSIFKQNEDDLIQFQNQKFIFILNEYENRFPKYLPSKLMEYFENSLFYCFTSKPVFNENIINDMTTKHFFNNKIASYSFKDALDDKTNLPIAVEYIDDENIDSDYDLSSINRIKEISNAILEKTDTGPSILITSSNNDLINYYNCLKNSHLRVAPILRHSPNDVFNSIPMREYFKEFLDDYNNNFNENILLRKVVDTKSACNNLEKSIIKKFKNHEIDLLLIDVSMFNDKYKLNILGDLRNPSLNTLFLDCDLNYGTLFEVLTCVNMVDSEQKSQGNVVIFRDLREEVNKTVKLFSNNHAEEDYTLKDYDYYLNKYSESLSKINQSNDFINDYNQLSKYYHILESFSAFDFTQTQIDKFNSYKDRYEHEINTSKRNISVFNPKSIDNFYIDLTYIDDLNSSNNNDSQKQLSEMAFYTGGDRITYKKKINDDFSNLIIDPVDEEGEFVKICPACNKKYKEKSNFCGKHREGVRLIYTKDAIKSCPKCGMKYPIEYNYCRKCKGGIPLTIDVYKIKTNSNKYLNFYEYPNRFSQISNFLTPENMGRLCEFDFTQEDFDDIIDNIKITFQNIYNYLLEHFNINLDTLTTKDKMFLLAKSFAKVEYKEGGGDLGYYEYNIVRIDDRAMDALQITTLVHELSHFLLAEIFEQIISMILGTDKTEAVEAFVAYILKKDAFNNVVDEYCAHTVEGRYAAYGYQDYGSYHYALSELTESYGNQYIDIANGIGNTFATYIKNIFEVFIDKDLREDIKKEFTKINDIPRHDGVLNEVTTFLKGDKFLIAIKSMLRNGISMYIENPQDFETLNSFAEEFRQNSYQ